MHTLKNPETGLPSCATLSTIYLKDAFKCFSEILKVDVMSHIECMQLVSFTKHYLIFLGIHLTEKKKNNYLLLLKQQTPTICLLMERSKQ